MRNAHVSVAIRRDLRLLHPDVMHPGMLRNRHHLFLDLVERPLPHLEVVFVLAVNRLANNRGGKGGRPGLLDTGIAPRLPPMVPRRIPSEVPP